MAMPMPSLIRPDLPPEQLQQVTPREVFGYAKAKGWVQGPMVGRLRVYGRPGALDQLLIPTDPSEPPFAERMHEVVETFARVEERAAEKVLDSLINFESDVLRFRVASVRAEEGSLPLGQVLNLLEGARRSLLSAAHSVLNPLRYHPRLSRSEAVKLVEACRMGQTERGSFIVAIACPLDAVDPEETAGALHDDDPFARQTTRTLTKALKALNAAIEEDRINSLVDEQETHDVSANLCEALIKMRPVDERGQLEFSPFWAPARPRQVDAGDRVTLTHDEFTPIESIYRQLRPKPGPTTKPRVAYVDELRGIENADGQREGEVVFTLFEEDEVVRAKARLTAEQYQQAYEAHNPSAMLVVVGQLHRGPRVSTLKEIQLIKRAEL